MAFEIEEIDVEEDSLTILFNLADATGVSVSALLKERERVRAHEEFWSDPCWIEPLKEGESCTVSSTRER